MVVENRSGVAGMAGTETVARSPADGHTPLLNSTSHAALRVVVPNAGLDPHRALLPVTVLSEVPMVMLVANNVPARDRRECLAMVHAEPGRFNHGSTGDGGTLGMAALPLTTTANLRMNKAPTAAARPRPWTWPRAVSPPCSTPPSPPCKPRAPRWREIGVDAEMLFRQALFVSAPTPMPVRSALHAAVARVQADPALQRRWAELGVDRAMALPPTESVACIAADIAAEVARWERVLGAAARPPEPPPAR